MVDRIASTPQELLSAVGQGGARLVPFKMSLGESLFHALADPNIAFLLINIGFLALIAWIFHPGFHVSLAVGVITMAVGLAILQTLPVQLTGFILLLVAATLFVLDVKAKAHGVLTTGGIGVLVLGGLLLFNPSVPSAHVSLPLIILVAAFFAGFSATVLRALVKAKERPVQMGLEGLIGALGQATSAIDPTGTVRARNETWTAESASGPIPAGASVRVTKVRGVKLVVEPAGGAEPSEAGTGEPSRAGTVSAGESKGENA